MLFRCLVIAFFLTSFASPAGAGGLFGGNKADDTFAVKSITGNQAALTGKAKDLKAGDTLYFPRSPFQFKVTEVTEEKIVIALPDNHNLAVGNALMRFANDQIKKGIATENRLKQALEE